ncbi:hypothetical protein AB1Y20_012979 [Prymnesium parvum]|uniref:Uncharacterized protein n=1 Tax=Prymnesium parvum TaxID=97485 RepID=A0AB34IK40_PRYPA
MTAEEKESIYLCTVREFDAIHKWVDRHKPPCAAWQLQEMGVSGTGSLEEGDSSGEIFWMENSDFLTFYYETFPLHAPADEERAAMGDEVGDTTGAGGAGAGSSGAGREGDTIDLDPPEPAAPSQNKEESSLIYKYWNLESDTLIQLGKDTGKYKAKYTCTIILDGGHACERMLVTQAGLEGVGRDQPHQNKR